MMTQDSKLKPKWLRALNVLENGAELETPAGTLVLGQADAADNPFDILCVKMLKDSDEHILLSYDLPFNQLIQILEAMDEKDISIPIPKH